jgi:hypothetical protein
LCGTAILAAVLNFDENAKTWPAPIVREGFWRSLASRAQNRRLEAGATRRAG